MMKQTLQGVLCMSFLAFMACGTTSQETPEVQNADSTVNVPADTEWVESETVTIERDWKFEVTGSGEFEEPLSAISYRYGGKVYLLKENVMGTANVIPSEDYQTYNIPPDALTACMTWWAGAGDVFYVMSKSETCVHAMHGEIGEGMDFSKETRFKLLKEMKQD